MEQDIQETNGPGPAKKEPVIGRGLLAAIVAVIAITIVLAAMLLLTAGSPSAVPPQSCAQQVVAYVNGNLVETGSSVTLEKIAETDGVYKVTVLYQGNEIPLYATKDCALLFTNVFAIGSSANCNTQGDSCSPAAVQTTQASAAPVKSARPVVELYVMAFCPYGVQVENAMKPVVDLLGGSADIRVRYIATAQGDTLATAQSLHGNAEAVEDVRQLCIAKHAAAGYWNYIAAFNAQCYPAWNDAGKLSACTKNITAALGIPSDTVDACAAGSEGLQLLRDDAAKATENNALASPTLFINGQKYSGSRTSEALKQAICAHFSNPPAACDTILSSQTATASGSC